eukprot:TRINITY_DN42358_c0_g1_i1.p2 TRINITY_DN42358_c0_g1~~TRINITY_DN42358_c0_g1_i1.p2  ORF type:complete len:155 (-),score=4.77 TRINITY_DN42358_c0_g1_i1:135-599(-)
MPTETRGANASVVLWRATALITAREPDIEARGDRTMPFCTLQSLLPTFQPSPDHSIVSFLEQHRRVVCARSVTQGAAAPLCSEASQPQGARPHCECSEVMSAAPQRSPLRPCRCPINIGKPVTVIKHKLHCLSTFLASNPFDSLASTVRRTELS